MWMRLTAMEIIIIQKEKSESFRRVSNLYNRNFILVHSIIGYMWQFSNLSRLKCCSMYLWCFLLKYKVDVFFVLNSPVLGSYKLLYLHVCDILHIIWRHPYINFQHCKVRMSQVQKISQRIMKWMMRLKMRMLRLKKRKERMKVVRMRQRKSQLQRLNQKMTTRITISLEGNSAHVYNIFITISIY